MIKTIVVQNDFSWMWIGGAVLVGVLGGTTFAWVTGRTRKTDK